MATEATTPRELDLQRMTKEADVENASKTGIGTRVRVGQTRGKNPQVIKWYAFDDSKPETLPKNVEGFMEVIKLDITKPEDDKTVTDYLIRGYNDAQYEAASDPLAEYVEPYWPAEAQTQFRLVVRNYSRGANVSIEEAVKLIKGGFEKQFSKPAETTEPAVTA